MKLSKATNLRWFDQQQTTILCDAVWEINGVPTTEQANPCTLLPNSPLPWIAEGYVECLSGKYGSIQDWTPKKVSKEEALSAYRNAFVSYVNAGAVELGYPTFVEAATYALSSVASRSLAAQRLINWRDAVLTTLESAIAELDNGRVLSAQELTDTFPNLSDHP